jgi:hypothetical protein
MLKFAHLALTGALFISISPLQAQTATPFPTTSLPVSTRALGPAGVRREVGNWLFNDSIFVSPGPNVGAPGSPTFIANLRRDKKEKLPLFRAATTRGPLNWSTLSLPSLRDVSAPGFDFAALQSNLSAQVATATTQGRVYIGWSLPVGNASTVLTKAQVAPSVQRLRAVLDAVAPTSALILEVDTAPNPLRSVADIDAAASFCDAILLRANPSDPRDIWPLKMARRTVEEQKDFDLPIFVTFDDAAATPPNFDARTLEYFMGGATGFVLNETPAWGAAVGRNPGLFAGAVTIEDAAILPSQNPITLQMADALRAAGRVPLVGRLPEEAQRGESLFAVLDNQTTLETLNGLDRSARNGGALYLEGLPDLKNKAILDKLADMTSTNIEILPAPRSESLNPDDPWLFGEARGREFEVTQRIKWTIKTSMAGQTRIKKGEDSAEPFAAARLANDTNGLLQAPLGKGRIMWLPHAPTGQDATARRSFYSAIAGNLQGAIVDWKFPSVEEEVRNGGKVHVALRASKLGTSILALWNEASTDANLNLEARGDSPLAFDLLTEKEVPATVVGYASNLKVTVPAHGFIWLTFGKTKRDFDKERLTARPKARIVK